MAFVRHCAWIILVIGNLPFIRQVRSVQTVFYPRSDDWIFLVRLKQILRGDIAVARVLSHHPDVQMAVTVNINVNTVVTKTIGVLHPNIDLVHVGDPTHSHEWAGRIMN